MERKVLQAVKTGAAASAGFAGLTYVLEEDSCSKAWVGVLWSAVRGRPACDRRAV